MLEVGNMIRMSAIFVMRCRRRERSCPAGRLLSQGRQMLALQVNSNVLSRQELWCIWFDAALLASQKSGRDGKSRRCRPVTKAARVTASLLPPQGAAGTVQWRRKRC